MAPETETQETQTTETETQTETTETEASSEESGSQAETETQTATESTEPASISEELKAQEASEKSTDTESEESTTEGDGGGGSSESGAPDKYETFTRPDGFAWEDADDTTFADLMKDSGLSQDKAQAVMDFVTKHGAERVIPGLEAKQKEEYAKHRAGELARAKENPLLIGEDGEQWGATMALVNRVVKRFTGTGKEAEGVMSALEAGGFLDQEAFLVLISQIGGVMTSDTLAGGGDPALEDDAWDNMTPSEKIEFARKQREDKAA